MSTHTIIHNEAPKSAIWPIERPKRAIRAVARQRAIRNVEAELMALSDRMLRDAGPGRSQTLLAAGSALGWVRDAAAWPLEARGADGADVSRELFHLDGLRLVTRQALVPMMVTTDPVVAAADCLFYAVRG